MTEEDDIHHTTTENKDHDDDDSVQLTDVLDADIPNSVGRKRKKTYFSPNDVYKTSQASPDTIASHGLKFSSATTSSTASSSTNIEDKIYLQTGVKSMEGYQKSKLREILYYLLCVLSLGIVWILVRVSPLVKARLQLKRCSLKNAQFVLVKSSGSNSYKLIKVKSLKVMEDFMGNMQFVEYRMFEYRYMRYLYDSAEDTFELQTMDPYEILAQTASLSEGLDLQTHRKRLLQFGANSIALSSKRKSTLNRVRNELFQPVYLFQFAFIILWMVKQYYVYGVIMLLVTLFVVIWSVINKMRNVPEKFLAELVKNTGREVRVIRDGQAYMVGSAALVPGDIIEINSKITLPCDFVLVRGSVEVDESALTGDTATAHKFSVFSADRRMSIGNIGIDHENTLIGGSKIISYKSEKAELPLAVVIRTGFNSSRGRMIRQFLLSDNMSSSAYITEISSFTFTFVAAGILSVVFTVLFWKYGTNIHSYDTTKKKRYDDYINFINLLLVAFPPFFSLVTFLPITLASRSLKNFGILARGAGSSLMKFGLVDCVCYDKTGTLTESSLSLYGVVEVAGNQFKEKILYYVDQMSSDTISVMAACHNLAKVNHVITGDKLEVELFMETKYDLKREKSENHFIVNPPADSNRTGLIRVTNIYSFSATLQRTSVVVRLPNFSVLTKGSPNAIRRICKPDTIPKNFNEVVRAYGLRGYRLIAYAKKILPDETFFSNLSREEYECDMTFLGFFVMKNKLHPRSESEIISLRNSNILSKMITGDSIYTAISVAKECCIVDPLTKVLVAEIKWNNNEVGVVWRDVDDGTYSATMVSDASTELAITGEAFSLLRNYFKNDIQRVMYYKLITRCHIFGEMLPSQKAELVNDLKEIQFFVSMVGDGSNDSLALIASDVGFSLSETETTFASQFSADVDHCLTSFMIRHARSVLEKILVNFKFVLLSVLIQYTVTVYNDMQTLNQRQLIWSSFCTAFLMLVSMSFNKPVTTMHKQRPPKTIMRIPLVFSVVIQAIIQLIFLNSAMAILSIRNWYLELTLVYKATKANDLKKEYLFLFSNFQILAVAVAFNFNSKYSRPFRNFFFILSFLIILFLNIIILFPLRGDTSALNAIQKFLWTTIFDMSITEVDVPLYARDYQYHRLITILIVTLNFIFSIVAEFIVQRCLALYSRSYLRYSNSNLLYRKLLKTIPSMSKWI